MPVELIYILFALDAIEGDLVTKSDFAVFREHIDRRFAEVDHRFDGLSSKLEYEVANISGKFERFENRLTIRFAAFLFVGLTALASLIKFWLSK